MRQPSLKYLDVSRLADTEIVIGKCLTPNYVFVDHRLCSWETFVRDFVFGALEAEQLQLDPIRFAQFKFFREIYSL